MMAVWLQVTETVDTARSLLEIQNVSVIGVLLVVKFLLVYVSYLLWKELKNKEKNHKEELKLKDDRIKEAVENHLNDIKKYSDKIIEVNKEGSKLIEDTNKLIEELKKIYKNGKSA